MKQKLHKQLTLFIALFGAIMLYAQPGNQSWTFDSDLEGWSVSFGSNGPVVWDTDGGNGALKLTRTTNNANLGVNTAGGLTVDADNNKFIKLKLKNMTSGTTIRVGATGGDTTNGNQDFGGLISPQSDYAIVYVNMTGISWWNGTLTNLWIAIRQNCCTASEDAFFDSIEIVNSAPADEEIEFIQNPNFEDSRGISHMTGNQTEINRAITAAEAQNGDQSLRMEVIAPMTQNRFTFSNFIKDYSGSPIPANSEITVKVWVRSNRTTPADLMVRIRLNEGLPDKINIDDTQTTSGIANTWEELTFTMVTPSDVSTENITFWFAWLWVDGSDPKDPQVGDIFYLDNESAVIGPVLSTEKNTLEGVKLFPNPAKDRLTLKTPRGGDISIFNILGARVKAFNTDLKEYDMNVSDLKSGIYLLRVQSEGKQFTQKLVLK